MKQLFFSTVIMCSLLACNTATTSADIKDTTTAAATSSNENVSYSYPIQYASDFTIGDSKYAQTVLELWKDYDNNTFDNHKDAFADSATMDLFNMSMINKPKDSIFNAVKAYRSSLKNAVSSVEVVTTLKPKRKDESWVCVWGKEIDTHKNGIVDSVYLNENWMFNKDGKVVYMSQYQSHPFKK